MCIRVDLPDPDGPMMATYSPSSMASVTPRRAATAERPGPVDLGDVLELDDRARSATRVTPCPAWNPPPPRPPPPPKPPPPKPPVPPPPSRLVRRHSTEPVAG